MSLVIYTKPGCPYCEKAIDFMQENEIPYVPVSCDPTLDTYPEYRDALFDKMGHRSFPIILCTSAPTATVFDVIGGYTELVHAHTTLRLHEIAAKYGMKIEMPF